MSTSSPGDYAHIGRAEGDLFEQLLHDRVEPPRPDILGPLIDRGGDIRHGLHRVLSEGQGDALGLQELHVLTDEGVPRLGQDADKILPRQGLQLDPDGEASLELGDEIRRLGDVEGPRRDEEDMVGPHHAVLGRHRRAFHDRQEVALHPFARDVGSMSALAPRDFVQLVEEDDAGVLGPANGLAHRLVHVDQLLRLLLGEETPGLPDFEAAPAGFPRHEVGQHVLDVDADLLHSLPGEDLEHGPGLGLDIDLDLPLVELARTKLGPELVPCRVARGVG